MIDIVLVGLTGVACTDLLERRWLYGPLEALVGHILIIKAVLWL